MKPTKTNLSALTAALIVTSFAGIAIFSSSVDLDQSLDVRQQAFEGEPDDISAQLMANDRQCIWQCGSCQVLPDDGVPMSRRCPDVIQPTGEFCRYDAVQNTCALKKFDLSRPKPTCLIGGCNNEVCFDSTSPEPATTCVDDPLYACYDTARCEVQSDGQCGWTQTPELVQCLEAVPTMGSTMEECTSAHFCIDGATVGCEGSTWRHNCAQNNYGDTTCAAVIGEAQDGCVLPSGFRAYPISLHTCSADGDSILNAYGAGVMVNCADFGKQCSIQDGYVSCTMPVVAVRHPADINNDGTANAADVEEMHQLMRLRSGQDDRFGFADYYADGVIDLKDYTTFVWYYAYLIHE